jgi:S1-C subfamily serine protease
MGVDRNRVCELYSTGPDDESSGSGYRIGDRLVLTARHVIAPAVAAGGGQILVRAVGGGQWLSAAVEWHDADSDAALISVEDDSLRSSVVDSVLRSGSRGPRLGRTAGATPRTCTGSCLRSGN